MLLSGAGADINTAGADDGHAVTLKPGATGSKLAPRYSPKGTKIALTPVEENGLAGYGHLEGRLLLGPKATRGTGHRLVLARSAEGKAFDLLWIDKGGDGSLSNDDVRRVTARTSRGSVYTSYTATLLVNHGSLSTPTWQPYAMSLWVAAESEAKVPAFVRFSRRGFLHGSVVIAEVTFDVIVSDGNNDAILGADDWWTMLPAGGKQSVDIQASRKVGDFVWSNTKAYKLILAGTTGCVGRIVSYDPGITPEEDARKRDPCWDDKRAERAKTPLRFAHDIEAAIKDAKSRGAHYFLDFETSWCGPCKLMDRWVYTAEVVVEAAKGIVCIKVDGDKHKDLKAALKVGSFPTGVLLDAAGKEVARFSGYRTAAQMVTFFKPAHAGR